MHSTIQLNSARSGSLTKISIHVYQNSVESFVKQREVVFEVRMYTFIEFSIRLSLGLNSYVHRSAVSAPKSEDEHVKRKKENNKFWNTIIKKSYPIECYVTGSYGDAVDRGSLVLAQGCRTNGLRFASGIFHSGTPGRQEGSLCNIVKWLRGNLPLRGP